MSSPELTGFPPIRDKSFVYYIGVIGEISCGKSTFINGLFGDCLTEAGPDRTTLALYRFFESVTIKDNKSLAHRSRVTNKNKELKQAWEKQKKKREESWINWTSRTPRLTEFYSYPVAPSNLIPHRDYDNLFCITDFPGFNDSRFDDEIFRVLKQNRKKFDCLIYVLDCNKCLTEKYSKLYFEKIMAIIHPEIISGQLKLMLVFNKYDLLDRRGQTRKILEAQKMNIQTILQNDYRIPSDKVISFNISASRLMAERIVLDNDIQCLQHNMTLIDDIDDYAGKFFGDREIERLQDVVEPKERLLIYHQEAHKEMRNLNSQEDSKLNSYAVKQLFQVFRQLRSPMTIFGQIGKKLSLFHLSANGRHAGEERQRFLEIAGPALECLASGKHVCVESVDLESKSRVKAVLTRQIDTLVATLSHQLRISQKDPRSKLNVSLTKAEIVDCFAKLQACLVVLDQDYIENLARHAAASGLITSKLMGQLKSKIDMKKEANARYFHTIARGFVNSMIEGFADVQGSCNHYYFWYHQGNLSTLINHVTEFYAENKKLQREYLSKILFPYDQKIDESKKSYGRAISMMQFYMSMDQIRSLCDEFKQFSNLCCKLVEDNDQVFSKLVEALSHTW